MPIRRSTLRVMRRCARIRYIARLGRANDIEYYRLAELDVMAGPARSRRLAASAACLPTLAWMPTPSSVPPPRPIPAGRVLTTTTVCRRTSGRIHDRSGALGIRLAVIGPRFLDISGGKPCGRHHRQALGGRASRRTECRTDPKAADLGVVPTTHTNRYIYKHGHILREELDLSG